jgi:hypothetical protein
VEGSTDVDLGFFGEVCVSMGVISVEEWKSKEKSSVECWNEEEGGSLSI